MGQSRMAIDCCARRTRMLRASLNLPGTVPTCHILRVAELASGCVASSESSEIDSIRKRSLLLRLLRPPTASHNRTQLLFSPSVNDSPPEKEFLCFWLIAGTNTLNYCAIATEIMLIPYWKYLQLIPAEELRVSHTRNRVR